MHETESVITIECVKKQGAGGRKDHGIHLGQQNQGENLNHQTTPVLGAAHALVIHGNLPLGTPLTQWAILSQVSWKNGNTDMNLELFHHKW